MSLYRFPAVSSSDGSICLQEVNGALLYGTSEQLQELEDNHLLSQYPKIEKERLDTLQHSLSPSNLRETFVESQSNRFQQTVDDWANKGMNSFVNYVASIVNDAPYGDWLKTAGQTFQKAQKNITNAFARSEESVYDTIARNSSTLNWSTNWIRCIAIHNSGHRIAVCQNNDYIRIFCSGIDKLPITLKHRCQNNVTDMAWKPYDRMTLAVACSDAVLIWRLDKQNLNVRPSVNCAEVYQLSSFSPVTQCIWDTLFDQALFIASASSSRLQLLDTSNGGSETIGSWSRGRVRHVWISPDGRKLAVAFDGNFLSVYDRHSWDEERWKKLNGPCTAASWTPQSDVLFFTTHDEPLIRGIHFVRKLQNMGDDQSSTGSEIAVPVYDLSEVELRTSDDSNSFTVGGSIRDMVISPDGQRIAITFNANPAIVALFVVGTVPTFFFTPCGLINGAKFGPATILSFFPNFQYGSLLIIVWSSGKLQYIPLLYGPRANEGIHLNKIRKQKPKTDLSMEDLLTAESVICEPIPRTNDRNKNGIHDVEESTDENSAAPKSRNDLMLFSSEGLFDQLIMKCTQEGENSTE